MGAANVIPGVSGGTIAFVTGIYERLINAIKSFDGNAIKLLKRRDLKGLLQHTDAFFLMALLIGVAVAFLTLARVLEYGFEHHPTLVSALFFGLIAASIWSIFKMVKRWSIVAVIGLIIGCGIAVSMAFLPQAQESQNIVYLMLCGTVAMCSMIIPGVSGSFVLILMGNYNLIMIESFNKIGDGEFKEALSILVPVGIGAVVGMVVLSRFLSWLFKRFHDVAIATITGFVAGSLVTIWPWKSPITKMFGEKEKIIGYERFLPQLDGGFGLAFLAVLAGAALMFSIELLGKDRK